MQVSKRDLPNPVDWKTYLQPVAKFVAAVDTDKAWNAEGAVLFAGYIKEAKLRVGDKITLQLASVREYASNRVATSAFSGSITDAEAGKEWQGSDDQRLMTSVMRSIFDAQGQSSGSQPTPPQMQGTSTPAPNTGTRTYKALNSQFLVLSDILDDIRDNTSLNGNEYNFVPRWNTSAKNKIVYDLIAAPNAQPQINFNSHTFNINLDSNNFVTGAGNSLTATDYANRIITIS